MRCKGCSTLGPQCRSPLVHLLATGRRRSNRRGRFFSAMPTTTRVSGRRHLDLPSPRQCRLSLRACMSRDALLPLGRSGASAGLTALPPTPRAVHPRRAAATKRLHNAVTNLTRLWRRTRSIAYSIETSWRQRTRWPSLSAVRGTTACVRGRGHLLQQRHAATARSASSDSPDPPIPWRQDSVAPATRRSSSSLRWACYQHSMCADALRAGRALIDRHSSDYGCRRFRSTHCSRPRRQPDRVLRAATRSLPLRHLRRSCGRRTPHSACRHAPSTSCVEAHPPAPPTRVGSS